MYKFLRRTPPKDARSLAGKRTPLNHAIESLRYYEVHVRGGSNFLRDRDKEWSRIHELWKSQGLHPAGEDYPDFRQWALLDFAAIVRRVLSTRLSWYDHVDWEVAHNYIVYQRKLESMDNLQILAMINEGLKDPHINSSVIPSYIVAFLTVKRNLSVYVTAGHPNRHDQLSPMYTNALMQFISVFKLHYAMIKNKSFWQFMSTMHMFPFEVCNLDAKTFGTRPSDWHVNSYALALGAIRGHY